MVALVSYIFYAEVRLGEEEEYKKYFRITRECLNKLLNIHL